MRCGQILTRAKCAPSSVGLWSQMAPCTVYSPGTEAREERHDEMPAKGTQHGDRVQRDQGEDQPILDQRLALLGEESDAVA